MTKDEILEEIRTTNFMSIKMQSLIKQLQKILNEEKHD